MYWRLVLGTFFPPSFSLITVKEVSEYHQLIMAKKSSLFGLLLNWEKTVNCLSDFYYVGLFHLLNSCNQKDKHVFHNKIFVGKQAYRQTAGLSEGETISVNWESPWVWYKLNLEKYHLTKPAKQNIGVHQLLWDSCCWCLTGKDAIYVGCQKVSRRWWRSSCRINKMPCLAGGGETQKSGG